MTNPKVWLRDLVSVTLLDLASQRQHVAAVKRRLKRRHLVEDAAQRPDIGFLPVGLVLHHLRADKHTHTGYSGIEMTLRYCFFLLLLKKTKKRKTSSIFFR